MERLKMEVPFNNTIVSDNEFIASLDLANLDEEQLKELSSKTILHLRIKHLLQNHNKSLSFV